MTSKNGDDISEFFRALMSQHEDKVDALNSLHLYMRDSGLLKNATLRVYRCARKGHLLATVFSAAGMIVCVTELYKMSHGLNEASSVESAREKNTIDKEQRTWPGHVFDVSELAKWGDSAQVPINCRDVRSGLGATHILSDVKGIIPGHGGAPILV